MIFVLGPHRSGTSLVAGMLSRLGIYMGPSWADEFNPTGYFEDRRFLALSKQMVGDWRKPKINIRGSHKKAFEGWLKRRFGYHRAVAKQLPSRSKGFCLHGVKDPRLCLTAGELAPIAERIFDIGIVSVDRHIAAQIASLMARNDLAEDRACRLALQYLDARDVFLSEFDGHKMAIKYERILDNPTKETQRLAEFIGVDDPQIILHAASLTDPNMNHYG